MKLKAYGWLAAGVLAAGLNASYHDGGLEWAHQIADGVGRDVRAVVELASGRADQFLAEAQLVADRNENAPCLANAVARVRARITQTTMAQAQSQYDHFQIQLQDRVQVMTDRQQAALDRAEAEQERAAARQVEVENRLQARLQAGFQDTLPRLSRISVVTPMPAMQWAESSDCPHVHVRVRVPRIQVPAVQISSVQIPAVQIPKISIPEIRVPEINVPQIRIPEVKIPQISVPQVQIPQIHTPQINVPAVHVDSESGPI